MPLLVPFSVTFFDKSAAASNFAANDLAADFGEGILSKGDTGFKRFESLHADFGDGVLGGLGVFGGLGEGVLQADPFFGDGGFVTDLLGEARFGEGGLVVDNVARPLAGEDLGVFVPAFGDLFTVLGDIGLRPGAGFTVGNGL